MKYTLSNGIEIWYERNGNSDTKIPLVFLGGLSQSTAAWSAIAPAFYEEHQVILIDLADQGQSGSCSTFRSYDAHAADVSELLSHLNLPQAIIIGISYGSAVAQHFLVNHAGQCAGALLLSTFAHTTALF
ncbi:MAG: alpha/beta fold hydrolase, partial [Bacteroidia bacterium]